MALKKSELYFSLWAGCDELRGGMDASQYKDYVLVLLFIKYVSDKYAGVPYAPITIPKGASFKDMAALKGAPDIGDRINKQIVAPLANANKLADMPDFNDATKLGSGKEMVERLTNLIAIFENKALDFSKNRAEGDDILSDAYEYLMRHFATWRQTSAASLRKLKPGSHPKDVIAALSEDLLAHYDGRPLIDPYAVYQHLMDYWAATMQDDCYLIADDGWKAETSRIVERDKKGKEKDKGWTCDLVPKALIVARYFAKEQEALIGLEEEHGGEEGAFTELEKVNKANVTARLKEITPTLPLSHGMASPRPRAGEGRVRVASEEEAAEAAALTTWLTLATDEAELKRRLKDADAALDAMAYGRYPKLTEAEVRTLVVDDKWLAALDLSIHGEMDRISQALTQRVKELAERYETPLPQMTSRVAGLEAKVNRHLERMGFPWK